MKRLLDIVLGTVLAVAAVPVVLLLAVGVCVTLRTVRPLFVQRRIGYRGRPFSLPKLRTLPVSTPRYADKYSLDGIAIPGFCRFLRNSHLDELPQLWLVPFGKMSLVGPRPEMAELAATFDPEFVASRTTVRPGCTGLWQISVDSWRLVGETPAYDLAYVENASARLDLWVLWRTLIAFFPVESGIELSDVPARVMSNSEPTWSAVSPVSCSVGPLAHDPS